MMSKRLVQSRNRSRRGFTLLELVISMMIVAILVPVLYSCLKNAYALKSKTEAAVAPARDAEQVFDWLRQDLNDAIPPSVNTGLIGPFEGITGTDNRRRENDDLQFYTTADSPLDASNNNEIKLDELTIITTPNGSDHVLVRKITRDLITQPAPNPDVEVICRGVGGFGLRYFDGTNWTDTWDSTAEDNTIPAAVEVTLTLDRPNGTSRNPDGTTSFKYVRVIPLGCSSAAFDSTVNTGTVQ
jgi:type II secretion system protein J